jgi:hypothetical protein
MAPPSSSTPIFEDNVPPDAESPDGVDLTLIQWFLTLTPYERLEYLEDWVAGITELQNGGRVPEP